MGAALQIFLSKVVPILGGLIAIAMYASPVKAVYTARQQGNIGDLNPLPFVVAFISTSCWVAYGLAAPDYNMFLPNIPGLIVSMYNSITCYGLAPRKTQDMILSLMCSATCIVVLLGIMTRFVVTAEQGNQLWGITCNIITIGYYGAPLSTAVQVIRTRDSSSIYLPTAIANLVNATLWVAYGFAVKDFFIWLPNGIGAVFAIGLTILCLIFPKSPKAGSEPGGAINKPVNKHLGGMKQTDSRKKLLDDASMEEGRAEFPVPVAQVRIMNSSVPKGARSDMEDIVLKAEDHVLSPRYGASDSAYGGSHTGLGLRSKSRALDKQ